MAENQISLPGLLQGHLILVTGAGQENGRAIAVGLARSDVNAAEGVLGRKLSLVVRDDLSTPPKSIQKMPDPIDNEKVVAVFGPSNSGNAMAWKHIPTAANLGGAH